MKTKLTLLILMFFSSIAYSQSQSVTNKRLLMTYGADRIEKVFKQLKNQRENDWFKDSEKAINKFYILPTVKLKNQEKYSFQEPFIDFIDFTKIDTLAHFFILDNQERLIAHINKLDSVYFINKPYFKSDKRYKVLMDRIDDKKDFLFRLPYFTHIWWVLKNKTLYVFNKCRLVEADKYIKKKFKEDFFKQLINESL